MMVTDHARRDEQRMELTGMVIRPGGLSIRREASMVESIMKAVEEEEEQ